jgi:hypothetical protein
VPGYAPTPIVQQQVNDCLSRWAERATGLRAAIAEQNASKLARPYVSIEWIEEPGPTMAAVKRTEAGLPITATVTLSPAADEWAAVVVNLARPGLLRDGVETLSEFTDRYAVELQSYLFGRVLVERDGVADIVLTPVALGDLWRAEAVENASVVLGETASAKITERVYTGLVRVWVIGAARTAVKAGDSTEGRGVMEVTALLVESLVEPWCREMFDAFGVRCGTPEPQPVTATSKRSNAVRETRAYIDIQISVTARFGVAPNVATALHFGVGLQQDPPPAEDAVAVEVQVDLET